MAFKELKIIEKQSGTPPQISIVTSRISSPTLIQPTYTFDLSMMYGVFVPEVSFGYGLEWDGAYLDVCINVTPITYFADLADVSFNSTMNQEIVVFDSSMNKWTNKAVLDPSLMTYSVIDLSLFSWNAKDFFYTKNEIDALLDSIVGGTY